MQQDDSYAAFPILTGVTIVDSRRPIMIPRDRCSRRLTPLIVFPLMSFVLSCSGDRRTTEGAAAGDNQVAVSGDVFIVTKAAANLKLGLVTIAAYPESVIVGHLARRRVTETETAAFLDAEIAKATRRHANAQGAAQSAATVLEKMPLVAETEDEARFNARHVQREKVDDAYARASRELSATSELKGQRARLGSAGFYFEQLPAPIVSTKTDADGKFTISLTPNERWVLVANAQRQVMDRTEYYYWMLRVVPNIKSTDRVFFSNDNLVTIPSDASVLYAHE